MTETRAYDAVIIGAGVIGCAIALDLGFAESASFTRAFARHFGVTPGRYRTREKER